MLKDNIHLSVSQISTYIKSPQQWAGKYILGMQDNYKTDALEIGSMFHKRVEVCAWKNIWDEAEKEWENLIQSLEGSFKHDPDFLTDAVKIFYTLRKNFECYDDTGIVEREKKVVDRLHLWGAKTINFVGYVDAIHADGTIVDYKSVTYFTKPWDTTPPIRGGLPSYKSYELQAWLYMKVTGLKKAKFVEILKKDFKKYTREQSHQVIEFEFSDARDNSMMSEYMPIMEQIHDLYEKYEIVIDNFNPFKSR